MSQSELIKELKESIQDLIDTIMFCPVYQLKIKLEKVQKLLGQISELESA